MATTLAPSIATLVYCGVTSPEGPSGLPSTGNSPWWLVLAGLGLVAAGGGLRETARRGA